MITGTPIAIKNVMLKAALPGSPVIPLDRDDRYWRKRNNRNWWKAVGLLLTTQAAIADVELLAAGRGRQAIQC